MDHFLILSGPGSAPGTLPDRLAAESQPPKMADGTVSHNTSFTALPVSSAPALSEEEYSRIVQAVAALLLPTITAAVDRAVSTDNDQIRKELRDHAGRISEAEHHISEMEEEILKSDTAAHQASQIQQYR